MTPRPPQIERWILGAAGAGKSTFAARFPNVIDQDDGLIAWGDPADRAAAIARAWGRVPALRAARESIAFVVIGDKPDLLAAEIAAGRAAGARVVGYGVRRALDICLARNRARARALPDEIVVATWRDFERLLPSYPAMFDAFELVDPATIAP
jgi:hypothetical protein